MARSGRGQQHEDFVRRFRRRNARTSRPSSGKPATAHRPVHVDGLQRHPLLECATIVPNVKSGAVETLPDNGPTDILRFCFFSPAISQSSSHVVFISHSLVGKPAHGMLATNYKETLVQLNFGRGVSDCGACVAMSGPLPIHSLVVSARVQQSYVRVILILCECEMPFFQKKARRAVGSQHHIASLRSAQPTRSPSPKRPPRTTGSPQPNGSPQPMVGRPTSLQTATFKQKGEIVDVRSVGHVFFHYHPPHGQSMDPPTSRDALKRAHNC